MVEEEITNVGIKTTNILHFNVAMGDKVLVALPPMNDENIRALFSL